MSNMEELRDSAIRDKEKEITQTEAALEELRAELEILKRAAPIVADCYEELDEDHIED